MSFYNTPLWGIARGCRLLWRCWDDEYLVYNSGSGDTHLLDATAAETLKRIEQAAVSAENLESWLVARFPENSISDARSYVCNVLHQFHSLALIEEVTP